MDIKLRVCQYFLPYIETTTMSNINDIKTWDDEWLAEDLNDNNDDSVAKFTQWRRWAKEKKAAEEQRKVEAEAEARRKVEEEEKKKVEEEAEVQRKAAEQERLQVAQEAYLTAEEAQKHKVAKEEAKWKVSGAHLGVGAC